MPSWTRARRGGGNRLLLVALLGGAALAAGCARMPSSSAGEVVVERGGTRVEVRFSEGDRALIHRYYRDRLPPGLAKRDRLPPGLRRQVHRRGRLPPGLERRRLPHELERRLSRLPEGYVRVQVGADVVLMDAQARVVVDVVRGIYD
ncbi:MAG: hypothetical protein GWO02_19380 [Gammaproteobacteria bacterium]|nr:hypothetical protein [Gammaproteobacteria bacterium]